MDLKEIYGVEKDPFHTIITPLKAFTEKHALHLTDVSNSLEVWAENLYSPGSWPRGPGTLLVKLMAVLYFICPALGRF